MSSTIDKLILKRMDFFAENDIQLRYFHSPVDGGAWKIHQIGYDEYRGLYTIEDGAMLERVRLFISRQGEDMVRICKSTWGEPPGSIYPRWTKAKTLVAWCMPGGLLSGNALGALQFYIKYHNLTPTDRAIVLSQTSDYIKQVRVFLDEVVGFEYTDEQLEQHRLAEKLKCEEITDRTVIEGEFSFSDDLTSVVSYKEKTIGRDGKGLDIVVDGAGCNRYTFTLDRATGEWKCNCPWKHYHPGSACKHEKARVHEVRKRALAEATLVRARISIADQERFDREQHAKFAQRELEEALKKRYTEASNYDALEDRY